MEDDKKYVEEMKYHFREYFSKDQKRDEESVDHKV